VAESLRCVAPESIITAGTFSTGASNASPSNWAAIPWPKSACRPTGGPRGCLELNLMQLEGQAVASVRAIAARLRELGRLHNWAAAVSRPHHHTSGRIDVDRVQCGGPSAGTITRWRSIMPGDWNVSAARNGCRNSSAALGHPLQPEPPGQGRGRLPKADWKRTHRILAHGRSRPAT